MKKFFMTLVIGSLSAAALSLAAADKTVLNLNFEDGFDSDPYEFGKRGSAAIVEEAGRGKVLCPVAAGKRGPAGIVLRGEAAGEMTPEAFTWSMKFKYTGTPAEQLKKGAYNFLMDCRYRGKAAKGGMSVNLVVSAQSTNIVVTLGFKDGKAASFNFKTPGAADGKWHDLAVTADPKKLALSITLDGKTYTRVMQGVPAPAAFRLTIGDCVGSSYSPFRGMIDDVKLTVPAAAPAAK